VEGEHHSRALATAQTVPVRGDVEANVTQHLRLAGIAAAEQAEVLVFPELSLTGYELDLARRLAFSEDDPRLAPLIEAAVSASMTLVVGAPVEIDGRLYLGAFILGPDRTIALYTKRYLGAFAPGDSPDGIVPPAEATVFQPGERNPLVPLGGGAAAVAICADTGRPSHAQEAAERGARAYLASMFVIPSDYEKDATNLRTYAARHAMAVVLANFGGPSGGLPAAGRSAIWSESGALLAALGPSGSGVVIAREEAAGWRAKSMEG
jgi:predicted amidohydrolase